MPMPINDDGFHPVYNVVDYGADPTGATDSTPAIQAALNAAAAAKATVYVPAGGVFLVGGAAPGPAVPLDVASDTRVWLDGTLLAAPIAWADKGVLEVRSRSRVVIEGKGTIDGQAPDNQAGRLYGVAIRGANDVTLRGITLRNLPSNGGSGSNPFGNAGDGVLVMQLEAVPSTDIIIDGVTVDGATRNGISITSGQRVSVRHCVFRNVVNTNPGAGIDVEKDPSVPDPTDISIFDCDFEDLAGAGVLIIKGAKRVQVLMNRFRRCRFSVSNRAEDVLIAFNQITEFRNAAVFVYGEAQRTKVAFNTIRGAYDAAERAAVAVYDTDDLEVVGNVISNTFSAAVFVDQRSSNNDNPAIAETARLTIADNQMIDCIAIAQRANVDGVIVVLTNSASTVTRHVRDARIRDNRIHDTRVSTEAARHGVFVSLIDPADLATWDVGGNTIVGVVTRVAGVTTTRNPRAVVATLAPGEIPAGSEVDVVVDVPGLGFGATGSSVDTVLATPGGMLGTGIDWVYFPSAANTLTVRFRNRNSAPATPTALPWSVMTFEH